MVILKIDGELYFSTILHSEDFDDMATHSRLGGTAYDEALLQFVFHLESCDEAVQCFDGFAVCPVCGAHNEDGVMTHKAHEELVQ